MAESKAFATYGYQIDNTMNKLIGSAIGSIFLIIPLAVSFSGWFLLFLLLPVCIFVYIKRSGCSKPLLIASRYLILGNRIIYYRNVARASLDKDKQVFTLLTHKGQSVMIAAEKFPTNARKSDKIRRNKGAKFDKVTERIISRLRAATPDIVIS